MNNKSLIFLFYFISLNFIFITLTIAQNSFSDCSIYGNCGGVKLPSTNQGNITYSNNSNYSNFAGISNFALTSDNSNVSNFSLSCLSSSSPWANDTSTIYPSDTNQRVLIGGATDDTRSALQVAGNVHLSNSGVITDDTPNLPENSIDPNERTLYANDGVTKVLRWDSSNFLYGGSSSPNGYLDLIGGKLGNYYSSPLTSLDFVNRQLYSSNGVTPVLDWSGNQYTIDITGSTHISDLTLIGTSTPYGSMLTVGQDGETWGETVLGSVNINPQGTSQVVLGDDLNNYAINTLGISHFGTPSSDMYGKVTIGNLGLFSGTGIDVSVPSGTYVAGNFNSGSNTAQLGTSSSAGYFTDGSNNNIFLATGTYAINSKGRNIQNPTYWSSMSSNIDDALADNQIISGNLNLDNQASLKQTFWTYDQGNDYWSYAYNKLNNSLDNYATDYTIGTSSFGVDQDLVTFSSNPYGFSNIAMDSSHIVLPVGTGSTAGVFAGYDNPFFAYAGANGYYQHDALEGDLVFRNTDHRLLFGTHITGHSNEDATMVIFDHNINVSGSLNATGQICDVNGCIGSSSNTYNSTYNTWAYNMTLPAINYVNNNPNGFFNYSTQFINFSGDLLSHDKGFYYNTTSNNLNISGNYSGYGINTITANITNNVTLAGIYYYQTTGACNLSINESRCTNGSGVYDIG